jgi:glucose-6-phosphate 1-dehydrogenase
MSSNTKSDATIFVIFGGTGDLTSRKIAPALYNLFLDGWMPSQFSIIGTGRTQYSDEQFRTNLLNDINQFSRSGKADKDKWAEFVKNVYYQVSDVKDSETYKEFGKRIDQHNADWKTKANVIYYLAVSPNLFPIIASNIAKAKLAEDKLKTRIVIEKPFGHDLDTAKELNQLLSGIFDECQIYRIDYGLPVCQLYNGTTLEP